MSSPVPRRRRGAHRTRVGIVSAIMPSVLAVLAVSALVTSLAVWRGEDPGGRATATTARSSADREALSEAPSSPKTTKTRGATATTPTPTGSATTAPAETSNVPGGRDFDVEVVVLNQSSRRGLAGTVADVLRAKGWAVPFVGNFHGVVPATTVYYPPGQQAAAQAAAASLPTAERVRPSFGNLSTTRLTVVVTTSYPG